MLNWRLHDVQIEPHMVVVFRDAHSQASNEDAMRANYVEYGRRLEKLISEVKAELAKEKTTNAPAMAATAG